MHSNSEIDTINTIVIMIHFFPCTFFLIYRASIEKNRSSKLACIHYLYFHRNFVKLKIKLPILFNIRFTTKP